MTDSLYHPEDTKLINIPVKFNGKDSTLLLYSNTFKKPLPKKDYFNDDFHVHKDFHDEQYYFNNNSFQSYASFEPYRPHNYSINNNKKNIKKNIKKKNTYETDVMVVPIPNFTNQKSFGLVDLEKFGSELSDLSYFTEKFLKHELNYFEKNSKTFSYEMNSDSTNYIPVIEVGNYKISVAKTKEDLKNINWNEFKLPSDFKSRFNTVNDTELYPYNMSYVVAKATKPIEDDGFGIIYENPDNKTYFPTAHENKQKSNNYDLNYKYDVNCYDFSDKKDNIQFKTSLYSYESKIGNFKSDNFNAKYFTFNLNLDIDALESKINNFNENKFDSENKLSDYKLLRTFVNDLKKKNIISYDSLTGNKNKVELNTKKLKYLTFVPIKTHTKNQNIWG